MSDAKSPLTHAQQARRDRIVDAGLALLAERDYDRIQVKDVAEAANVALGTLYHYFSSKEHLFAEVLVRWAGTLRTNISRNPLRGTTDTQRLTQVINRSVCLCPDPTHSASGSAILALGYPPVIH